MRSKLVAVILFASALAGTVLVLRQDRLEMSHQIAVAYRQIDQSRHELWQEQSRIADRLEAQRLMQAIERAKLELEPLTPAPGNDPLPGISTVRSDRND